MVYQRCRVGIEAEDSLLHIFDLESEKEVARHTLCSGKGKIISNKNHYRDREQQVADYEQAIRDLLGDDYGAQLCALLKRTSPKIYKDQLTGAKKILAGYQALPSELLTHLCQRPRLTVSSLRDYLAAYTRQPERLQQEAHARREKLKTGTGLSRYAELFPELNQEASHEFH